VRPLGPALPASIPSALAASIPPAGLDGLDPAFSRLVEVPYPDDGTTRTWHLLDTGPRLAALGVEPAGTLLCVHGNPTWSYLWRRLASASASAAAVGDVAWRVVAVDQLEMGFSERTGRARTLAQRVRDLGALTDVLGLTGPVVTLGHDWGGAISLGWAVDHPDLLAGVVVLNTAVHQPETSSVPAVLRLVRRRTALGPLTTSTPAFLEATLALARPRLSAGVADGYRAPYRDAARRAGIGAFVADIPVDAAHPSTPELDRIAHGVRALRVPAFLLWGPRDPIFGDRYLADLVDRLPHADVHRAEHAGHLVAEDVDLPAVVLGWLAERRLDQASAEDGADRDASASAPPAPLWSALDARAGSSETALVEMAPPTGPAPRVVSWRLLARRVREVGVGLVRSGVAPGDRVLLLVPPGADLTAVLYACLRIGAVVVIADASLGIRALSRVVVGATPDHVVGAVRGLTAARALGWPGTRISTVRLPRAQAAALGVRAALPDLVAQAGHATEADLPPAPEPSDVAAVLFTSGSTGPAKGVVYTHAQLGAMRDALAEHYGIGEGTGLVAGFAPFALLGPALGVRSVTPDMDVSAPRTLTARAVAAAAAAVDATMVFLSPAALTNVVATAAALDPADRAALARVELVLSAGAPVPERLLAAAVELMPRATAHTPYGMTECLLLTDVTLEGVRAAAAPGTGSPGGVCVGRPTARARVLISALDGEGRATGTPGDATGVTGEVVVHAPHLKERYDRLHLTDRAATTGVPGPRWHRTGDVGHLDDQGRLWIEGRLTHVLVTADGFVTPVGVEQAVERVPGVGRAALVGVGPSGTAQPVLVVETLPPARRPGLADPTLAAAVRSACPLAPAAVLVVPGLPTDVRHNSKIDRTALAAWADGVLAGGRVRRP